MSIIGYMELDVLSDFVAQDSMLSARMVSVCGIIDVT
jgi:hypothetical protein